METEFIYQYKKTSHFLQEEKNKIFSFSHNTEIDKITISLAFFMEILLIHF